MIKLLKSKEASNVVDIKSWAPTLDTDELPRRKLPGKENNLIQKKKFRVKKAHICIISIIYINSVFADIALFGWFLLFFTHKTYFIL